VRRILPTLGIALTALLGAGPPAASALEPDDLALRNLQLVGTHGWRPDNFFAFNWDGVPFDVYFVVRWPGLSWAEAPERTLRRSITVPPRPGQVTPTGRAYVAELWLETTDGSVRGPAVQTQVLFDADAPPPPHPAAPTTWLDDDDPILASVGRPDDLLQASRRSGYAVSVSPDKEGTACVDPRHCTAAEIDLPGSGDLDQQLWLPPQLEGVTYLHVATVSGAGVASETRSVPIRVDSAAPTIRFDAVPSGWVDHPVAVSATALDTWSGTAVAGPDGPFTALAVDGGTPVFALGEAAAAVVAGEGVHLLSGWGRDAAGNTGAADGAVAIVRIDETPPRLGFANSQQPDDPELIRVAIADDRSGPDPERGAIAVRAVGSSAPFQPLPTKVDAAGLSARWSSDDYQPGAYEFRATGFDRAGNAATSTRRADGSAMVLRNPIKTPTRIASGFGGPRLVWQRCRRVDGGRRCHRETVTGYGKRPALRTVPYGRSLHFGGVLLDAAGHPLAGRPVEVVETFGAGADPGERRTTVLTGPHGRFGARLAPGPSRWVEARFAGTRTLTRAVGERVSMAVRAGLRFHASTEVAEIGGDPVVFSGRLLDDEASIPRTGRPIQLEFRVPGGTWSEFRTVMTSGDGSFRYPYSFTDDDSQGIRFQFRAVSPEQAGWPYRPAASAPVAVTGY
jgi:hypothetical protein